MSGKPFVFVLGSDGQPLMPCTGKRARLLLSRGRAVVVRIKPFVIQMKDRAIEHSQTQPLEVKIDPGSRFTGICLSRTAGDVVNVLNLIELEHRGRSISKALTARAALRRGRRNRKTRYRQPRFLNRTKPEGWLAPSLRHRLETTIAWVKRLARWAPVASLALERVKFDMQKLQNPEISGTEYQQGTLYGREVKEYLLEKWQRKCMYCEAEDRALEVEHIVARANSGSDRVSNLGLACRTCNQAKGSLPIERFLSNRPSLLAKILAQAKKPLRDAAAVNSTRQAIFKLLLATGLPVMTGTGAETKHNRSRFGIPKTHALDAACVGQIASVNNWQRPHLEVKCTGSGRYGRTLTDKYGFPRGYLMKTKRVFGFATGDLVYAWLKLKVGPPIRVLGRLAVRASGYFAIVVDKVVHSTVHVRCTVVQKADGYSYTLQQYRYMYATGHPLALPLPPSLTK